MKAVHFGAGNIGRGFVGLLLHEAGYEVVFADVAEALITQLAAADSYRVHEVGENPAVRTVENFRALNSSTQEADVVAEIATADIVTTAVGPHILKFVAPVIAKGIAARAAGLAPLQVMACENAINATDILKSEVAAQWDPAAGSLDDDAVFANTAVDRIVPNQEAGQGLDVTVETFYEWVIDRTPFAGKEPVIPGATFVDDLAPYIERKLFTVNTGHAAAAYFGFEAGLGKISDAMADQDVAADVRAVLDETKELLVAKHGFNRDGAGSLRPEDPGPLLQPVPAGHREPGGPGAAAEAQPARTLHRARCGAGRTRDRPGGPARRDRRGPALQRPGRRRGRGAREDPGLVHAGRGDGEDHGPGAGPPAVRRPSPPWSRRPRPPSSPNSHRESMPPTPELTRAPASACLLVTAPKSPN